MSEIPSILFATEYHSALEKVQRLEDQLLWIAVGGGLASLGAAAFVLINRAALKIGFAWLAPLPFILTGALLLGLFMARLAAQAHVHLLRSQANLPAPQSSRSHYPSILRNLMLLPGLGTVGLYLLTLAFSLRAVYSVSRAAGTIFGLGYFGISMLLCVAGVVALRQWRGNASLTSADLFQVLLPYPGEMLIGSGLFFAGFMAPIWTVGLNIDQLGVLNALFRRAIDFTDIVPLAAVAALGLSYWLVVEGLLVPAGQIWMLQRRGQFIPYGYAIIAFRVILSFLLAFALGGLPLLVLSVLIWLQQAGAVLNTPANLASLPHPRRVARERFDLLWSGLLFALRFYGGVLVWVGSAWSFTFLLLLFCITAFLGVAFTAAQRARRARILTLNGAMTSEYHLRNAPRWQRSGFLAAGLTTLGLVMIQILAETNDFYNSYLAVGYGRFNNGAVEYSQAGLVNGLLVSVDLLIFGLLGCALYIRLLKSTGSALTLLVERVRAWLSPLLFVCGVGLSVAFLVTGLFSLILGGLLAVIFGAALWCER